MKTAAAAATRIDTIIACLIFHTPNLLAGTALKHLRLGLSFQITRCHHLATCNTKRYYSTAIL